MRRSLGANGLDLMLLCTPGLNCRIEASGDLVKWTSLTGLSEVTPGQFQFTDAQATNLPQRFYRLRSP